MSDNSAIEWTNATWNAVTGCEKVSPGCDHCYAETFAERWRGIPGHHFENGFDVVLRPDKLTVPLRWRKPRKVFVNSMSDLFHKDVPGEYIAQVFAIMALTPQHTYQVLTKRHGRMRSLLNDPAFHLQVLAWAARLQDDKHPMPPWTPGEKTLKTWPLPNVWMGVSVEDQKHADLRIPALLGTPAAVRFLSCEPLLGPISLQGLQPHTCSPTGPCPRLIDGIDWVIAGGESGHGARPMHPDWARSLRDQCADAGVAFFFKQAGAVLAREWGCSDRKGHNPEEWPEPFPREFPKARQAVAR